MGLVLGWVSLHHALTTESAWRFFWWALAAFIAVGIMDELRTLLAKLFATTRGTDGQGEPPIR